MRVLIILLLASFSYAQVIPLQQSIEQIPVDSISADDPRFDSVLSSESFKARLVSLESMGYKLVPELSYLSTSRACIPGSSDTTNVETTLMVLHDKHPDRSKAYIAQAVFPDIGFAMPAMSYIEYYTDPDDSTCEKVLRGVDQDGNDEYTWIKFLN